MWGKSNGGKKKSRGLFIAIAIVAVLVLVIALLWNVISSRYEPEKPGAINPPGCPKVEVVAVPGTWESKADDDPIHPHANKNALLLNVTEPLQDRFSRDDVKVYTVPYVAQFRNPQAPLETSYNKSREQGTARMKKELSATFGRCPATKFILTGFSQGAVIAGDVASDIGNGRGPIAAKNVLGVALVADGRRENGQGINPGEPLNGEGLELALGIVGSGIGFLSGSDATMKGSRKNGFGSLNDVTYQLCDARDVICNASKNPLTLLEKGQNFLSNNPIHAKYNTNKNVIPGSTATRWILDWAVKLIRTVLN